MSRVVWLFVFSSFFLTELMCDVCQFVIFDLFHSLLKLLSRSCGRWRLTVRPSTHRCSMSHTCTCNGQCVSVLPCWSSKIWVVCNLVCCSYTIHLMWMSSTILSIFFSKFSYLLTITSDCWCICDSIFSKFSCPLTITSVCYCICPTIFSRHSCSWVKLSFPTHYIAVCCNFSVWLLVPS